MPAPFSGGPLTDAAARPALPHILCYHKVERRLELGVTRLSPRRFVRQMERFAADGWTSLTLDQLVAGARGERAAGAKEVAITFDDAYRGLREYAFPVIESLGFSATCFVITEYAGRLNEWDVAYGGRRFAHLAWRDLRRWEGRGITFASHTATHRRLTWLDDGDVRREMARSRAAMASALGHPPRAVSYPFGAAGLHKDILMRGLLCRVEIANVVVVKRHGHGLECTLHHILRQITRELHQRDGRQKRLITAQVMVVVQ